MTDFVPAPKSGILIPVGNLDSTHRKLRDAVKDEDDRFEARKKELEASAPDESTPGSDAALGEHERHNPVAPNASFDKKVYFFPESFNALRRELEENWRDFFLTASPDTGTSPAWCMVFDAPQFIGFMNGFTGLSIQVDTGSVDYICKQFLNALRAKRGVSKL